MKPELLQTISNVLVFIGAIMAALGGFGSQYFGKQVSEAEKVKSEQSQEELEKNINELLKGNETLKERLVPFEELASEIHPTLKIDAALTQLKEDFKRLEEIASKYEFIPLDSGIRSSVVKQLKLVARNFNAKNYEIQVTHETWTNAATQKYAAQLAAILTEAGFKVDGPNQITYYLIQQSAPVEWGTSPGMLNDVAPLFEKLLPIFGGTDRWTKKEFDKTANRLRIHFGGAASFKKDGVVVVE